MAGRTHRFANNSWLTILQPPVVLSRLPSHGPGGRKLDGSSHPPAMRLLTSDEFALPQQELHRHNSSNSPLYLREPGNVNAYLPPRLAVARMV